MRRYAVRRSKRRTSVRYRWWIPSVDATHAATSNLKAPLDALGSRSTTRWRLRRQLRCNFGYLVATVATDGRFLATTGHSQPSSNAAVHWQWWPDPIEVPTGGGCPRKVGQSEWCRPLGKSPSALSITLGYHRIRDVHEQRAELVRRQIAEARIVVFGERLCNLVPVRGDQVLARKR
jgi:hypothetical protein